MCYLKQDVACYIVLRIPPLVHLCQIWSHISNIKSFLPVEAEISVTKVFITANMKNSKSHCKQEVDVR
jgi:hypothetical protein